MIAAEAVASEIHALGARDFFLVTGGDQSLWFALHSQGIRLRLARSEAAAVYMADAYARVSGRPTYVYGQYGPGAAAVAGALAEPYWSSSPVVAMPTSMRRQHRHRWEYQELEQLDVFAGFTRWQAEAQLPDGIPSLVRAGAIKACAGVPGPVYVGLPSDMLEIELPDYRPSAPAELRVPLHRPVPSSVDVDEALRILREAVRPLIIAGNGVHQSGAEADLTSFAERLALPVATSLSGKGSIPETHRLAVGPIGRYSRKYSNAIAREADVVLTIGSRLGGLVTDSYGLLREGIRIIHVDTDPAVAGWNFPTELGIQADATAFLREARQAADGEAAASPSRLAWLERIEGARADWRARYQRIGNSDGNSGPIRPEAVFAAIQVEAPDDLLVLADTGYAAAWAGGLLELQRPGLGYLRADGSLGWSFPAAIGAKLAAPERPVIAVIGDGGFGYNVGELETAVRLGAPIVVLVLNNQSLAFEEHVQRELYSSVVPEVNDLSDVDHGAIARAFGANGARVRGAAELMEVLAQALRADGPTVIDVVVERNAIAPVTRFDAVRDREL